MTKIKYNSGDLLLFDSRYHRFVNKLYPEPDVGDKPNLLTYVTDPTPEFYFSLESMEEEPALLIYQENMTLKDLSTIDSLASTQTIETNLYTVFCFLINNQAHHHAYSADKFLTSKFYPYLFLDRDKNLT